MGVQKYFSVGLESLLNHWQGKTGTNFPIPVEISAFQLWRENRFQLVLVTDFYFCWNLFYFCCLFIFYKYCWWAQWWYSHLWPAPGYPWLTFLPTILLDPLSSSLWWCLWPCSKKVETCTTFIIRRIIASWLSTLSSAFTINVHLMLHHIQPLKRPIALSCLITLS